MKTILKTGVIAAALIGAIAMSATPSEARWRHHNGGAVAAGFVGGLAVGAIAANSYNNGYYGYGYGYGPTYGYGYAPGYAYYGGPAYAYDSGPAYYDSYAYAPRRSSSGLSTRNSSYHQSLMAR